MDKLSDRVMGLIGMSHEVDAEIAEAIGIPFRSRRDRMGRSKGRQWLEDSHGGVETWSHHAPRYTASLDAAMSLVPEGWSWGVTAETESTERKYSASVRRYWTSFDKDHFCRATTPALALCASALKARGL